MGNRKLVLVEGDSKNKVYGIVEYNKFLALMLHFNKGQNRFRRLRGIATVKMSTDEMMSLTRGEE
ncbi:MAG: hypothetical protein ABFS56_22165 [Pseudomonadota bacterium]